MTKVGICTGQVQSGQQPNQTDHNTNDSAFWEVSGLGKWVCQWWRVQNTGSSIGGRFQARPCVVGAGRCMPARTAQVRLGTAAGGRPHTKDHSFPGFNGVVRRTVVVCVKKLLEPLKELEIILEASFDQFVHGDDLRCLMNPDHTTRFSGVFPQFHFNSDKSNYV